MSKEPKITYATVRESQEDDGSISWDIECRFEDGQKFAAIQVDGDFPELALKLAEFLTKEGQT